MDKSTTIALVMLDYSKAFDCLDYELLISKLHYFGVGSGALEWFRPCLFNRERQVQLDISGESKLSSKRRIKSGVFQGFILGPLLFVLYTSDLTNIIDVLGCFFFVTNEHIRLMHYERKFNIA